MVGQKLSTNFIMKKEYYHEKIITNYLYCRAKMSYSLFLHERTLQESFLFQYKLILIQFYLQLTKKKLKVAGIKKCFPILWFIAEKNFQI